jgi:glutamine synthetase
MPTELDAFLAAHPEVRFIDLLLHDIHGVDRGKRVDVGSARSTFANGLLLPGSMFALDVPGGTVQATGLGFDEGDADRPCMPIPGTLLGVPWLDHGVAQAQVTMHERDGRPFAGDPRHALARVLGQFRTLGLTPVVAVELEFYFIDRERTATGLPQPPRSPLTGRREFRTQINSMVDLDDYSAVLADIDATCRAQQVPSTTQLAEYGPGQFEVNLLHVADALAACDQAARFKRIVKCVARRHGMDATFLPKPYRDMAGSGLHVHVSLVDAAGTQRVRVRSPAGQRDDAPCRGRHARHDGRGHGGVRAAGQFLPAIPPRSLRAADGRLVGQQPRRGAARAGERCGEPAASSIAWPGLKPTCTW